MTLPQNYDITIKQGATFQRWFALKYPDGSVVNLATAGDGYTVGRLVIRDAYYGTEVLSLTTDNGGVNLTYQADANGTYWTGYLTIGATDTAALEPWGEGVYDFEVSDGLHDQPVFEGKAVLSPTTITS